MNKESASALASMTMISVFMVFLNIICWGVYGILEAIRHIF